jgi:hypothetical protein
LVRQVKTWFDFGSLSWIYSHLVRSVGTVRMDFRRFARFDFGWTPVRTGSLGSIVRLRTIQRANQVSTWRTFYSRFARLKLGSILVRSVRAVVGMFAGRFAKLEMFADGSQNVRDFAKFAMFAAARTEFQLRELSYPVRESSPISSDSSTPDGPSPSELS